MEAAKPAETKYVDADPAKAGGYSPMTVLL
jgi:hypothetical protein